MNNWKKYVLAAVIVTAAGFGYIKSSHRNIPADLRDAVSDNRELDTSLPVFDKNGGDIPVPAAAAPVKDGGLGVSKDDAANKSPSWVAVNGGSFMMGVADKGKFFGDVFGDAKPRHNVDIKTFDMSKTAVTVRQYKVCWLQSQCTEPGTGEYCNWNVAGRGEHPINCVSWNQANQYARFISKQPGFEGARLPSESEWEYAAKSGGRNQKYPWGNEEPTCDRAVMYGNGDFGCGTGGTMPVCSKPDGNTAQGLCDMAGNVMQWVQDKYQGSYKDAPTDGSAFEVLGCNRVLRGGDFFYDDFLRADYRFNFALGDPNNNFGFRLARSR
jgi:formylglycine-generating enzyme required for sulfatase activity